MKKSIFKLNNTKNKGFLLLFAILLSTAVFSIALGISSIALNELTLSSFARDSNSSFMSADTGIECALFNDHSNTSAFDKYIVANPPNNTNSITNTFVVSSCGGNPVTITHVSDPSLYNFTFYISSLGSNNSGCALVSITKDTTQKTTNITAKGYNSGDQICSTSSLGKTERVLQVNY